MDFNADTFMVALRNKLPGATLSCKTRTDEQRAIMLDNVKAITEQYNHAPTLGSGALQQK